MLQFLSMNPKIIVVLKKNHIPDEFDLFLVAHRINN